MPGHWLHVAELPGPTGHTPAVPGLLVPDGGCGDDAIVTRPNCGCCVQYGLTQSRGFSMFEIADLCSAIGCYPIVTINDQLETADTMADFVEV